MNVLPKRWFSGLIVAGGILLGCLIAFCFIFLSKHPTIQISQSEINFGKIAAGTKATKIIDVRNTGTGNLVIKNIKSGCGCVQIDLSPNIIAPNETAQLRVVMDATEYGQRTSVLIFSNNPKSAITEVLVSADAAMQTIVEPSMIDFGQITEPEQLPISKEVNIEINENIFPSNESADLVYFTDHAHLKIDSSKPIIEHSKPIKLTFPSETPIGEIFTELKIQSASQTVSVRVIGTVRGQYYSLPPMVLFNQVAQDDETISKIVEMKCRSRDGITAIPKIESFELSRSLQSIITASISDKNKVKLTLSPSNPNIIWAPSVIGGILSVKCSSIHFDSKIVNIPIQVSLYVPKVRSH